MALPEQSTYHQVFNEKTSGISIINLTSIVLFHLFNVIMTFFAFTNIPLIY